MAIRYKALTELYQETQRSVTALPFLTVNTMENPD